MLPEIYLAQAVYSARISAFNQRAARGEFIVHELPASEARVPLAVRLRDAVVIIRSALDRFAVRGLLTRAE